MIEFVLGKGGEDGGGREWVLEVLFGFFSRSVNKTARECWAQNRRHIKHKRHTSPTEPIAYPTHGMPPTTESEPALVSGERERERRC